MDSPIVPVPKSDGAIRICGDYKVTINPSLQVDKYHLPRPNELFTCLTGGKVFTVQLTGNVTPRYSRVPQWNPPRGPNADMPCTRPVSLAVSNCVDNRQPRKYF